jgi:hypothetical protein
VSWGADMSRILWACAFAFWAGAACASEKLEFGPAGAWVKPAIVAVQPSDAANTVAASRALSDIQIQITPDGADVYADGAVRIRTAQGLAAGGVALTWRPDTESVTVHQVRILRGDQVIDVLAKGQTFTVLRRETNMERAMLDGMLTATLQPEDLRVGDVIEYAYTRARRDPVMHGLTGLTVGIQTGPKTEHLRMRAVWPKSAAVRWRQTPGLSAAKVVETDSGTELIVDMMDAERLKAPKGAPSRYAYRSILELSQFTNWGEAAALMAPLYRKAATLAADSPVKAEAAKIRAASPDQKVQASMRCSWSRSASAICSSAWTWAAMFRRTQTSPGSGASATARPRPRSCWPCCKSWGSPPNRPWSARWRAMA